MADTPYTRLTLAAKQAFHRNRQREPAIVCPFCEVQMGVADMLRHECSGPRAVHPLEEWICWADVMRLGVAEATFHRWIKVGRIEYRGVVRQREYRRRDVAKMVMYARWRWRTSRSGS